jgi:flagellar L-ring protein precursor FlgH
MRKLAPATAALGIALAAAPLAAQAPVQTPAQTAAQAAPATANTAPDATAAAAAPGIPAPAPSRAPRASWTTDRREFAVGDVITVLIDEQTLATANHDNTAVDRRDRLSDLSLGGSGGSVSLPSVGVTLDSRNNAQSQKSGDALRANRFSGEMTLRVVAVEPGGRLQVEGTKIVNVDKNKEQIAVKGWVRAQDVSPNNLVDSWRVADAEIVYTSSGSLTKAKGGILSKLLGALWP